MSVTRRISRFVGFLGSATAVLALGAMALYAWFDRCIESHPLAPQACINSWPGWLAGLLP